MTFEILGLVKNFFENLITDFGWIACTSKEDYDVHFKCRP